MEIHFLALVNIEMLSILRRSDENLFKIIPQHETAYEATQLSSGQCFQVNIIASICVDSKQLFEALAQYYISNGWFRIELDQLLNVWLGCLDLQDSEKQFEEQPENSLQNNQKRKANLRRSHHCQPRRVIVSYQLACMFSTPPTLH